MSKATFDKCENCGTLAANYHEHAGWIRLSDSSGKPVRITRSTNRAQQGSFITDFLGDAQDFCSIKCLKEALDKKADLRDNPPKPKCDCNCAHECKNK